MMCIGMVLSGSPPDREGREATKMLYGANVAAGEFLRALLSFGTFDEYHFFVTSSDPEDARLRWEERLKSYGEPSRVYVHDLFQLRRVLSERDFTAFHGKLLSRPLFALRSQFSEKPFPITGRIDTISYHFVLLEMAFALMEFEFFHFDSVICTSRAAKEACEKLFEQAREELEKRYPLYSFEFPGRFDVIPLGVDTELFRPRDKRDVRKLLGLPQDKLIILSFARFSAHEKMDLLPLLRVFRRVIDECPELSGDLLLLLAGENERYHYAEEVEKFAESLGLSEHVLIVKNPSFTEGPLIYSASDIFISLSDNLQESFGMTVIEAMSSGLPLLVSDWDGYKDTVVHGRTGFRVPTYWADCDERISLFSSMCDWRQEHLYLAQSVCVDEEIAVEYLLKLVKNPALRRELGNEARRRALEEFDWRVIIGKYEELWRELKEEAESAEIAARRKAMIRPRRFWAFKGYPTRVLKNELVKTTDLGREVLERKKPLRFYRGMKSVLLLPVIQDAMIMSMEGIEFEELVEKLLKKYERYSPSPQDIRYQILWMLKQGLLKVM